MLQRLRECATRDDCDALAINFCLLANRSARRRMVRACLMYSMMWH